MKRTNSHKHLDWKYKKMEDNKGIQHVLRKEGGKEFIYFGEKFPEKPLAMGHDIIAKGYEYNVNQWFLSCEQKGNKVEVAKDGHTSDIVNYVRSITPNGNIEEIIDQVNSDGLLIPLCYEVREEKDIVYDLNKIYYPKFAYFKEPENDGRANDRTEIEEFKDEFSKKHYGIGWPDVMWHLVNNDSRSNSVFREKPFNNFMNELLEEYRQLDRSEDRSSLKEDRMAELNADLMLHDINEDYFDGDMTYTLKTDLVKVILKYSDLVNASLKEENEKLKEKDMNWQVYLKGLSESWDGDRKQAIEEIKNLQEEIERLRGDLALAKDLISDMKTGIEWFLEEYPEDHKGCDDEIIEQANSFLKK